MCSESPRARRDSTDRFLSVIVIGMCSMENLISILLPNLNNRPFLEERIESIYRQTIREWELIIVDSYSDDGAWEFFRNLAARDDRVKLYQAPRKGIYAGWNECIGHAKGRYVYFATSDDTMANDCLEKLSIALDKQPECGIAHCDLKLFDEHSNEIPKDWWWSGLFAQSSDGYVHRRHIRKAPFDGLLHLFGATVYISITQMMIRRSLFKKTGLFPTNRGSIGDFQWVMKTTLMADSIFIPDTWGGWRQHSKQATDLSEMVSPEHWQTLESMSQCVLKEMEDIMVGPALNFIRNPLALSNIRKERIRAEFGSMASFLDRVDYLATEIRKNPLVIAELIIEKFKGKFDSRPKCRPSDWVQFLKNHGLEPNYIPVDKNWSYEFAITSQT